MNVLVVYYSKFGHTRKIAEEIASVLQKHAEVRILASTQLASSELQDVDLLIMGSPTHRMNLPDAVRHMLDRLPSRILRGLSFAAYDTSYKMSSFLARFTAAKKLARGLRKLGGKRILPPETFHVIDKDGPLYAGEIEHAREWAGRILERMAA